MLEPCFREAMQSVRNIGWRQTPQLALLVLAGLLLCKPQAAAFDLFAQHQVTVQFATGDGKPMADAEVRVYAPDDPNRVVQTGRTGKDGKFEFPADRDGMWSAEARTNGEIARATIRVGSQDHASDQPMSPYVLYGALGLLLALAIGFRVLRTRARARRR
jgi:hypothetical protein